MQKLMVACLFLCSFQAFANVKHAKTFDHLASLEGKWKGRYPNGKEVDVEYQLTSGGFALMESWLMPENRRSVTMYTIDDGVLKLTHYCPQGNTAQLALREQAWSQGDYMFDFVNASNTNLEGKAHLFNARISFLSRDKFYRVEDYKLNDSEDKFDLGQRVIFTRAN